MVNTQTLSELSRISKQLNSDSNSVNEAIEALNEQLREMNLGVEAWVQIADSGFKLESEYEGSRKYRQSTLLGFSRLTVQWELAINEQTVYYVPDRDDRSEVNELTEDSYSALLKASRELRITAVEHFDELLDELKKQANRMLAGVERAKKLASPTQG